MNDFPLIWSLRTQRLIIEHRFIAAQLLPEPERSKVMGECIKDLEVIQEELHQLLVKTVKKHNRLRLMSGIVYITAAVAAFIILITLLIRL